MWSARASRASRITQNDVRAIQLAKAALYAGTRLLMDQLGIDQVERITLAGAFGSHIDVKYAMVLGLIPDCPLDKVQSAGNAAGTGARIALLNRRRATRSSASCSGSRRSRRRSSRASRSISSRPWRSRTRPRPIPNLAKVVDLPRPTPEPAARPTKAVASAAAAALERSRKPSRARLRALDSQRYGITLKSNTNARVRAVRIASKGQVTIPIEIREKAGLLPGTEVEFQFDGDSVAITKARSSRRETRGQRAVRLLRGSATVKMSTDEIMALTRGDE